jgi:MFS family permease
MSRIKKSWEGSMTLEPIAEAALQMAPEAPASSEPWPSPRLAWYAVFVFSLTLMINFLDRGIITLLVPSIKADLHLTDFQMSLLIGFAFILFYVFIGLPVARWADVGTRRTIIGIGIGLWSAMTALCGLANSFLELFVCRVGTGVGESFNGPATYSMLADYFPPQKLPRAIAVVNFGFMLGSGLALVIGGVVIHFLQNVPPVVLPAIGALRSWQMAFLLVGLPGLAVAALVFTLKEPVRRGRLKTEARKAGRPASIPVRDVVGFVYDNRAVYGPMMLGLAFNTVLSIGTLSWVPSFYGRTFGWSMTQVGLISGLVIICVWPVGAMFGSWLAERWQKQGINDANMRVTLWAIVALVPCHVAFPLMPRPEYSVAISVVQGFFAAWVLGPQNAAIQIITPNEMRGQISALAIFIINVLGYGVGPTIIATFTDYVFGSETQLRYALSTAAVILGPLAAISVWWGLKAYGQAVARAQEGWS